MYSVNNYIRIYDLARREIKQVGVTRRFEDSKGPLGENITCNINCDGSKVSIIANKAKGDGFENVLYIYDVEIDTFTQFSFGKYNSSYEMKIYTKREIILNFQQNHYYKLFILFFYIIEQGKIPLEAYWDQTDKRFLSCLVDTEKKIKVSDSEFEEHDDTLSTRVLYTFFVSSEHGIKK